MAQDPARRAQGAAPAGGAAYVLAVDLGTGGPKAALVSQQGHIVGHASERVSLRLLPGGGAEQDPAEWWGAVTAAARRCRADAGVAPEQVVGVGCTGQWSGTVAADEAGDPLRPAVIWMDSRGAAAIRRQIAGTVNVLGYDVRKVQRWIRLTGGAPGHSGKDPTAHILWLRDAEPDVYRATHKFLEPVDWLNQQLTGRFAASHDSIAAHWVTDNRDIGAVAYDDTLLEMSGLERRTLPDLVPSATVVGQLTEQAAAALDLPPGLPVSTASGDLHSAAVGSGAVENFEAHLYIGTSSWISCHLPWKKTDPTRNVAAIPAALPGRYLVADEHETAGACLTFVAATLFDSEGDRCSDGAGGDDGGGGGGGPSGDVYRRMDDMVTAVAPGSGRVLFTPWLNGERSPVDDHTIRGGFHNLSLATTRAEMVRAAYEGVAFNSRWLLEAVEHFARRRFDSLAFIGGGANSAPWAQIHADVTGRTIRQMADPVLANVRGAGLLAWLALGRVGTAEMAGAAEAVATYVPDPSTTATYDELFAEFVNLYKRTRKIHRRLNRSH